MSSVACKKGRALQAICTDHLEPCSSYAFEQKGYKDVTSKDDLTLDN